MEPGVTNQAVAEPEAKRQDPKGHSDKELNFRRLEGLREQDRERAIRAEMETTMLKRELESIKTMLQPAEKDPLDQLDDYSDPDKVRTAFKSSWANKEARLKKEAEEFADRRIEQKLKERDEANYLGRLKSEYRDYDDVMTDETVAKLTESNPQFVQAVMQIPDEYARRKVVYELLKREKPKGEEPSIKSKVEENAKNPFYIAPGTGTPAAVDYDLNTPSSKAAAYAKLKAAQRRPIGSGQGR